MGVVKTFYEKILPDMAIDFVILTAKTARRLHGY